MNEHLIVRTPDECSDAERESFVRFAAEGEEVDVGGIRNGVSRAARLLWIADGTTLVAVAAVKKPFDIYKDRVFRKAGVANDSRLYSLELGYIYVDPDRRRRGYARKLVQRAMASVGNDSIYATTRADNDGMQPILKEAGFVQMGVDYSSERNDSRLLLFGRPTTAK